MQFVKFKNKIKLKKKKRERERQKMSDTCSLFPQFGDP